MNFHFYIYISMCYVHGESEIAYQLVNVLFVCISKDILF